MIARSLLKTSIRSFRMAGYSEARIGIMRFGLIRNFSKNEGGKEEEGKKSNIFSGGKKEISLKEAKQIFGIEEEEEMNVEFIKEKWGRLKKNNDPEKGGSVYLLQKIINAKKKLAKSLEVNHKEFDEVVQEREAEVDSKKEAETETEEKKSGEGKKAEEEKKKDGDKSN